MNISTETKKRSVTEHTPLKGIGYFIAFFIFIAVLLDANFPLTLLVPIFFAAVFSVIVYSKSKAAKAGLSTTSDMVYSKFRHDDCLHETYIERVKRFDRDQYEYFASPSQRHRH